MDTDLMPGCYHCDLHRSGAALPPREDVVRTQHWHVAHAFNSTLPGWLVVLPARHVTSLVEVGDAAAAELGTLLYRLAVALEQVTGCVKTYQMQFSEAEGFSHLHVHVVPRMRDQPAELRGPRVFGHLVDDESQWVSEDERDRVALAVRAAYAG